MYYVEAMKRPASPESRVACLFSVPNSPFSLRLNIHKKSELQFSERRRQLTNSLTRAGNNDDDAALIKCQKINIFHNSHIEMLAVLGTELSAKISQDVIFLC